MTTETTPPEWAIKRACDLSGLDYAYYKEAVYYPPMVSALTAFARYIAEHEPAPVDPLLIEAREIVAKRYDDNRYPALARKVRAGEKDAHPAVQFTLSGLRRGKELAEKKEGAR